MISITDIMKGKPVDYFPDALHKFHDGILSRVLLVDNALSTIMFHVSLLTGIPENEIRSKTRKKEIIYARYLFAYIAVTRTRVTLEGIANYIYEGYDHATVMYARSKIEGFLSYDKKVQGDVEYLKKKIKNGNNIKQSSEYH